MRLPEGLCGAGRTGTDSFAGELEQLRGLISPVLVGERAWKDVLDRARTLPAGIATFPFGFELPLNERRPQADLGIMLVGGTAPAACFDQAAQSAGPGSVAAGIARLLKELGPDAMPVRRVVDRTMMLEYDIGSAPNGVHPDPGVFLYPAGRLAADDSADQNLESVGLILYALTSAVGWAPDEAERMLAEHVYRAQLPDTSIASFGAFPSRERTIRLSVTGFRNARGVRAFLQRLRWPGPHTFVESTISRFERQGSFVRLGLHLDLHRDGLGPTLGLSFFARERQGAASRLWADRPGLWDEIFLGLQNEGLAVPDKIAALADWTRGPAMLFGAGEPRLFFRGMHHVKLILEGNRIKQCKGYVHVVRHEASPS